MKMLRLRNKFKGFARFFLEIKKHFFGVESYQTNRKNKTCFMLTINSSLKLVKDYKVNQFKRRKRKCLKEFWATKLTLPNAS